MKHNGDLIVTKENQNNFKNLTEVSGSIYVQEGATLTAPALTEVSGSIDVRQGATLTLPALTEVSGSIYVQEGATLTAPALTKSGSIYVRQGATLTLPALTEVSGSIDVRQGATLTAPALTKSGSIYVQEGATLNIPQTKGLSYKSIDSTLFIIEAEKTSKGIKIYTGYVITKILDGKSVKNNCFVSEKDGFYAHGETVKKSISDLQFKIVSEKLKKEPINADTVITVNHYRLITGACELGVQSWMENTFTKKEQLSILENGIKASDLFPILKKTGAYGLNRFESLKSF